MQLCIESVQECNKVVADIFDYVVSMDISEFTPTDIEELNDLSTCLKDLSTLVKAEVINAEKYIQTNKEFD